MHETTMQEGHSQPSAPIIARQIPLLSHRIGQGCSIIPSSTCKPALAASATCRMVEMECLSKIGDLADPGHTHVASKAVKDSELARVQPTLQLVGRGCSSRTCFALVTARPLLFVFSLITLFIHFITRLNGCKEAFPSQAFSSPSTSVISFLISQIWNLGLQCSLI